MTIQLNLILLVIIRKLRKCFYIIMIRLVDAFLYIEIY